MRVWSVEWPEGLMPESFAWAEIARSFKATDGDILVTNEMPFGYWAPTRQMFSEERAREWELVHEQGLDALNALPFKAIVSSRPILEGKKLANEAFALVGGRYEALHQKHLFPAENGWHEQSWFETRTKGYDVANVAGLAIGVLLCTEAMFPEKARWLGKLGADVIAVPRATGTNQRMWKTALAMASIVSGAYVVSSNREGQRDKASPRFGGGGIIYDCDGEEVAATSRENTAVSTTVDKTLSSAAKSRYPVYVRDTIAN